SRRLFRSHSTMANPSVVDTAAEDESRPLKPLAATCTTVEDLPFARNSRATAIPSDQMKEMYFPWAKRVTSTVSVAPGTRNSQFTLAPSARGPLARFSQNFLSSLGC